MLCCKDPSGEDGEYPLEPYGTEQLDIVFAQLIQSKKQRLDPMHAEEEVEEAVLYQLRVFGGFGAPGDDMIVEDRAWFDELPPGRECHQGSACQCCDPFAALRELILVNRDGRGFVCGHVGCVSRITLFVPNCARRLGCCQN